MNKSNLRSVATKGDIEEAVAQIVDGVNKALENVATKDGLKKAEQRLENKIDNVGSNVRDIKSRLTDLEHDTPTGTEFEALKKHVGFHYKPA